MSILIKAIVKTYKIKERSKRFEVYTPAQLTGPDMTPRTPDFLPALLLFFQHALLLVLKDQNVHPVVV